MELIKAVHLYKALQEIKDEKLPFRTTHAIVMLLRNLEPHVHFYMDKEKELIKQYAKEIQDGKYTVSKDQIDEFTRQKQELDTIEVEEELPKISLPDDLKISPVALNALLDILEDEES